MLAAAVLLLGAALHPGWAATPPPRGSLEPAFPQTAPTGAPTVLSPRLITFPLNTSSVLFTDLGDDGRFDLLAIDAGAKQLLIYRQHPEAFSNTPDQSLPLPPQTAWVAVHDVEAHPGRELLFSTPSALVYSRQDTGRFESEWRPLIQAPQVFTNSDFPLLASSLSTNQAGTHGFLPVVTTNQAILYRRNTAYAWSPEPPLPLTLLHTEWNLEKEPWLASWSLGPNPARSLHVAQSFRAKPDPKRNPEPETEALRKLLDYLKQTPAANPPILEKVDVDGDGQEDAVVWQCGGKTPLDLKTDVYVFLRGADHKLPERPTQTVHGHGIPIPLGSTSTWTPLGHLKGTHSCELALLEFNTRFASASGLIEIAMSHGLNWLLAIRPFRNGFFAGNPEASVPVKMALPATALTGWPIFINGDFNGDGRPDLLVRRSDTQWEVFFSTRDGSWFAPQPALRFDAPTHGNPEIKDLNHDGLADIIWHEPEAHRLSIFMTPAPAGKASQP